MDERTHKRDTEEGATVPRQACDYAAQSQRLTRHRFFFAYAYDAITHTPLWSHWHALLTCFRRLRTVALILRITTLLFAALQAGTLVLLGAILFLVLLPALALAMLTALSVALIGARHTNRRIGEATRHRRICVLFPTSNLQSVFSLANARDLVARGYTVILVSPYWLSTRGIKTRGRFYFTARAEEEEILLVRRYYFFSLRHHVLAGRETAYLH